MALHIGLNRDLAQKVEGEGIKPVLVRYWILDLLSPTC